MWEHFAIPHIIECLPPNPGQQPVFETACTGRRQRLPTRWSAIQLFAQSGDDRTMPHRSQESMSRSAHFTDRSDVAAP